MVKPTKKQLEVMRRYWKRFGILSAGYWDHIYKLEKEMSTECGIPDLAFFHVDGECAGIGNADRSMNLVSREKLEGRKSRLKQFGEI